MVDPRADEGALNSDPSAPATPYQGRRVARDAHVDEAVTPSSYVGKRAARPASSAPVTPVTSLEAFHAPIDLVTAAVTPLASAAVAPAMRPAAPVATMTTLETLTTLTAQSSSDESTDWTRFVEAGVEDTGSLPFALTEAFTGSMPIIDLEVGTTDLSFDTTTSLPVVREGGKRRAVKHTGRRGPLFKGVPSLPVLVGAAALAVACVGAVNAGQPGVVKVAAGQLHAASAMTGTTSVVAVGQGRSATVSRDAGRADTGKSVAAEAESTAKQREAKLKQLSAAAAGQSAKLKQNQWQLPIKGSYRLTARFGQSGLWASTHTGLDFADPTGTPLYAIANGTITEAQYSGAYGNRTILTLDDGTEIWYCHQSRYGVEVGQQMHAGELLGYIGATGHVTGPHLHLEVRPGAGDPVDPMSALQAQGLNP